MSNLKRRGMERAAGDLPRSIVELFLLLCATSRGFAYFADSFHLTDFVLLTLLGAYENQVRLKGGQMILLHFDHRISRSISSTE